MFLFWLALITFPIFIYYRFAEPNTVIFWIGVVLGFFQLGCFFGPTFSVVQELVPSHIRATVVAFYILDLKSYRPDIRVFGWRSLCGLLEEH